jgi:hypothetical protein
VGSQEGPYLNRILRAHTRRAGWVWGHVGGQRLGIMTGGGGTKIRRGGIRPSARERIAERSHFRGAPRKRSSRAEGRKWARVLAASTERGRQGEGRCTACPQERQVEGAHSPRIASALDSDKRLDRSPPHTSMQSNPPQHVNYRTEPLINPEPLIKPYQTRRLATVALATRKDYRKMKNDAVLTGLRLSSRQGRLHRIRQ